MADNKKRNKKPKPMAGKVRIQSIVAAASGRTPWRVALLEIAEDEGKPKIVVDADGDPCVVLIDIACWALVVEEEKDKRYQDIFACVPNNEGTVEPASPDDMNFVGIVPPGYKKSDVTAMVNERVEELNLPTVMEDDEGDDDEDSGDEEGGDDDQE